LPTLLENLQLEELSLVDVPANAQAMVSLFKRANPNDEEIMDKELEALKGEVEKLKTENEGLRKYLIDEGYVIKADKIEKKAPAEFIEVEGEKINKADIPAVILKDLEAKEKALEEAAIEKADIELAKSASEALPNFKEDVAKELFKAFSDNEELMEALRAADKLFAEVTEEVGGSDVDGEFAKAGDKLDALVKAYQEEHSVGYAKAYAEVAKTDEGKALINKSYEEK